MVPIRGPTEMYVKNKPCEVTVDTLEVHESSDGQNPRIVPIPPHRFNSLKKAWMKIYTPIMEQMGIAIRVNLEEPCQVELKTTSRTRNVNNLTKCEKCLCAFMLGFDERDSMAFLHSDDLHIDFIANEDLRTFTGESSSPSIKNVLGKRSQMKRSVEEITNTRIIVADDKAYILGFKLSTRLVKYSISRLMMKSHAHSPMILARL